MRTAAASGLRAVNGTLPVKMNKSVLTKSSSDIMAKVSASEDAVELFMNDLIEIVSENLGLNSPSTGIKLLSSTSDDKKK